MIFVREKQFYRSLLFIALPAALQQLISFAVNMMDTVMVGSLGEEALGAVAQGNQISVFMMVFIKGISAGTAVMISQYWGKKDMARIKNIFSIGFKLSVTVSVIFFIGSFFFPETVMGIVTDKEVLIKVGAPYVRAVAFSYLLYAVSENMIVMLRNVEVVKVSLVVSTVSLFINIGANYVLIFGKLGFPAMGVLGAAVATLFTRAVELLIVVVYVIFVDKKLNLRISDLFKGSGEMWRDYLRYGTPLVLADVMWGVVNLVKQMIIGRLDTVAVAANSISDVVLQLAMMFVWGMASASGVLIGKSIGAKEYDKTRAYAKTIQALFFMFGIVAALFTYFIRPVAVEFYNVSDAVKDMAQQFMLFGALTIWGTGYAAGCFQGINRGSGDVKFVLKTNLVCGYMIVIPMSFLAAFIWKTPAPVVYFFTRCDQIVKVFIAFFRLRTNRWIRNVTRD